MYTKRTNRRSGFTLIELLLVLVILSVLAVVVVPKFDFVKFMDSIVKYKITHLYLVPPQVVLVCYFILALNVSRLMSRSSAKCAYGFYTITLFNLT